ncbi:flagellar hook-length control protein [Strigomonas culicis]|uniref:Flagellar hook-length control protein n=1 Tax=Strigomonas culicis TaxID=28005 RepID=S9UYK5_9TRYP|nr:flagellar hook-length control protein [Strigomonas culicis]|eukprot:EPY15590.1 flagellar hook-length control protein [Strigomonas culicis]
MSIMPDSISANAEEGVLQISVITGPSATGDSGARRKERLEIDFVFDPLVTTLGVILEDMKGAIEEMGYLLPLQSLTAYLLRVVPSSVCVLLHHDDLFPVKEFYRARMSDIPQVKKELLRQHHAAKIHPEQQRGSRTVLVLSLEELAAAPETAETAASGTPGAPDASAAASLTIVGDLTAANVNTLINNSMTVNSTTCFPNAPNDPVPSAALRAWQATTAVNANGDETPPPNGGPVAGTEGAPEVGGDGERHSHTAPPDRAPSTSAAPQEVPDYVRERLREEAAGGGVAGSAAGAVSVEEKLRQRSEWLRQMRSEAARLRRKTAPMQADVDEVEHFRAALLAQLREEVAQLRRQAQAPPQGAAGDGRAPLRTQQEEALRDTIRRLQQQLAEEKRNEEVLLAQIRQESLSQAATPHQTRAIQITSISDTNRNDTTERTDLPSPPSAHPLASSLPDAVAPVPWEEDALGAQDHAPPADSSKDHGEGRHRTNVVHVDTLQSMVAREQRSAVEEVPPLQTQTLPASAAPADRPSSDLPHIISDDDRRELHRFSERLGQHCAPAAALGDEDRPAHDRATLLRDVRRLRERMSGGRSSAAEAPTAALGATGPHLGAPPANALRSGLV